MSRSLTTITATASLATITAISSLSNRVEWDVEGEAKVALERGAEFRRDDVIEDRIERRVGVERQATERDYVVVFDEAEFLELLLARLRHPQAEHSIGQQAYEYGHHHHDE